MVRHYEEFSRGVNDVGDAIVRESVGRGGQHPLHHFLHYQYLELVDAVETFQKTAQIAGVFIGEYEFGSLGHIFVIGYPFESSTRFIVVIWTDALEFRHIYHNSIS